jgi:PKD repeat protein
VTVAVAPGSAPLASITTVTLTATATDPEGDAVTFAWQLGDGQTASGQAVSHVFTNPGEYPVALTATDAKGAATKIETPLVVKGLAGTWADSDPRTTFTLDQTGLVFSGLYRFTDRGINAPTYEAPVDGAMSAPRNVVFYLTFDTRRCRYEGTLDESGDVFKVHVIGNKSDYGCGTRDNFSATRRP